MAEETFRKKIVIDSDELRAVEKELKKIARDLKEAAKGESQLRLEDLQRQQAGLKGKAGQARDRARKGLDGPGLKSTALKFAGVAIAADIGIDVFIKLAKTKDFSKLIQDQLKGFLDSVPVVGRIRQLIEDEGRRERGKILAVLEEKQRLADVARQFNASPRLRTEGRRLLIKQYEEEQARLLRNAQGRRF